MQVLNTTEEDIELHAGQHLGEFYFLLLTQQFWRENVAMSFLIPVSLPQLCQLIILTCLHLKWNPEQSCLLSILKFSVKTLMTEVGPE